MSNPLHPNLDTPCLEACIDYRDCDTDREGAMKELADLKESMKAMKEQMERSSKALAEVSAERMKLMDKLCDIRDTLKPHVKPSSEWNTLADAAIRKVLAKNFSVDIPE